MTKGRWEENSAAVEEAERFYKFIGEYVISFQWLEFKIDEILLNAGDRERLATYEWLVKQTNAKKVEAFYELARANSALASEMVDGWESLLTSVVARLHAERNRRNGLLHAQFLFDFLDIGQPVMRSHLHNRGGEVVFEHEDLSAERCEQIMKDLASLSLDFLRIFGALTAVVAR